MRMSNEEFNDEINGMWEATKLGLLREERFAAIEELCDRYIELNGIRPPVPALDRLASLCLYEEISDPTPWKTRRNEYPIRSPRMDDKTERREVGDALLQIVDTETRKVKLPPLRKNMKSKYVTKVETIDPKNRK